jgi:hypothetical protein
MTAINWTTEVRGAAEYADVNGLHMYYETFGSGRPLVVLHGVPRQESWTLSGLDRLDGAGSVR